MKAACLLVVLLFSCVPSGAAAPSPSPPQLTFEAPAAMHPLADRLREVGAQTFRPALEMTGLQHPGPAIRIILAPEDSPLAQGVPTWVSGYAAGQAGMIVLLPERVLSYPYGSIESVLTHELAHVLVARAARGRVVPRWFDEGLAMVAADRWDMEDRARLVWTMVGSGQVSLVELNALFRKDRASAQRAYVLANALVRHLVHEWGHELPGRMLALIARDVPFDDAFRQVTGVSLREAEGSFWAKQTIWNRWAPIITSTATLWMGIALLAFYAYRKQRQRALALRRQWDEEDE